MDFLEKYKSLRGESTIFTKSKRKYAFSTHERTPTYFVYHKFFFALLHQAYTTHTRFLFFFIPNAPNIYPYDDGKVAIHSNRICQPWEDRGKKGRTPIYYAGPSLPLEDALSLTSYLFVGEDRTSRQKTTHKGKRKEGRKASSRRWLYIYIKKKEMKKQSGTSEED